MTWFNDAWGRFAKFIPLVEDPSDPTKGMNLKAGADGGLAVEDALISGASESASADGTITASDATTYDPPLRLIVATGAGNITVVLYEDQTTGNTLTLPIAAGERIGDLRIWKVTAATTATGLSAAR